MKVISWNVLYGFNHQKAVSQAVDWIKYQDPDIIAFQELNGYTGETLRNWLPVGDMRML